MATFLMVRDADGLVVNAVLAATPADAVPPHGHFVVAAPEHAWIGWRLVSGAWVAPEQPSE